MARCTAIKPDGERCKRLVADASGVCSAHDPGRAEARRRIATRGGHARHGTSAIRALRADLDALAADVRGGELEPKVGAVVNQIINTMLRSLELERKLAEHEELERRLEALEARTLAREARGAWEA